jgi:hypothetical protein
VGRGIPNWLRFATVYCTQTQDAYTGYCRPPAAAVTSAVYSSCSSFGPSDSESGYRSLRAGRPADSALPCPALRRKNGGWKGRQDDRLERLGDAAGKSPAEYDGPDIRNEMSAPDWCTPSLSPTVHVFAVASSCAHQDRPQSICRLANKHRHVCRRRLW